MEVGTGAAPPPDTATQSPSSVAMVLADAPPNAKPAAAVAEESSPSRGTTAEVAQEGSEIDAEGGIAPPRPSAAAAAAPTTPGTPVSSVRYVGDNAERTNNVAEQEDEEDDGGSSSCSEEEDEEAAEYERTPTGAARFLPPDTTDTDAYQESPVKFRPVVVLEKESQRSPRKKLMDNNEHMYVEGGKGRSAEASDGLGGLGLPAIDEAAMGPSSGNENKGSGTRPPLSGSSAGKNSHNRRASRKSAASGSSGSSSSGRGDSGRTSTTSTPGEDLLYALLDRTLTFMGCASTSDAFGCGRTAGSQNRKAATGSASCRCGGGGAAEDQVWDGDVDDTATVNSVRVPSPRASPRVQIQIRTSAGAGGAVLVDGDTTGASSAVAHRAARAAAAASDNAHTKTNPKKNVRGIPTGGGCTGTGGKYVAPSPLTTAVPFDAHDLSTIVPDAADAHHVNTSIASPKKPAAATAGGNGPASPKADKKKDRDGGDDDDDDDDDDDEALLSPTHFFRPVSFDIDESSLAGSIAGSLASAIRGVR